MLDLDLAERESTGGAAAGALHAANGNPGTRRLKDGACAGKQGLVKWLCGLMLGGSSVPWGLLLAWGVRWCEPSMICAPLNRTYTYQTCD